MRNILREGTPEEKESVLAAHPRLRNAHFVSDDEKPGIQTIGCTAPDLAPVPLPQGSEGEQTQSGETGAPNPRKRSASRQQGYGYSPQGSLKSMQNSTCKSTQAVPNF